MNVIISGTEYTYVTNVKADEQLRSSFFQLANETFEIDFEPWYQKGYWGDRYITYALSTEQKVVANVSVNVIDTTWQGQKRLYIGIGTVMTANEYRQKGLSGWLMNEVLREWTEKCDAIFLMANDSVVNFYPKFGFERADEYQCTMNIQQSNIISRKLDMTSAQDIQLLLSTYKFSNPFSALPMESNTELLMFCCTELFHEFIYYVEEYDAIVIAEHEGEQLICYDIYSSGNDVSVTNILSAVAAENTRSAVLGFTPKQTEGCTIEPLHEEDTTLFVLKIKENVFSSNKLMIPTLARA
ncbi:GNAT family N-acetyltransferase [Paenibacillus arenosi]|uniref:GNAT family N-acetyltransferase n=1 Tax=Paenibacillus arenosi TaxID=2774142 RepID=A0ABR9AYF2_9BACL|nr:GNAT family N-acetyltransferase [Paenibacillus arenosi]MBD8497946.1 GNAT family N-acetyltransferase [Paenibacillus arenosi]